jgi:ribosomal protein L40E
MTEILTESFCERCGTRYTFQSAAPTRAPMKRLKVLSKGLKNYVLSDETSLEDAFADARGDEERAISSGQLDAFHQTFNFCMSCRQYTCANCWNEPENRCLTCAPDLSREVLPAAFPDLDPMAGIAPLDVPSAPANEDRAALLTAAAWPEVDLPRDDEVATGSNGTAEASIEVAAEAPAVAGPVVDSTAPPVTEGPPSIPPAPVVAPTTPAAAETTVPDVASDERAAAAAAQTSALLARFRPDKDLDEALAAYERETAPPPTAPEAAQAAEEPAAEVPAAAEAPAAAEVPAAAEAPAPAAAEAESPPAAATPERRDDRVEIPTWRIVAPDPGTAEPGAMPPVVTPSTTPTTPVWPPAAASGASTGEGPQWPSAPFLAAAPPAARARDAMWAASSLEVVEKAAGGVQSCVSCGLPLSATARFCRRCGSRQG